MLRWVLPEAALRCELLAVVEGMAKGSAELAEALADLRGQPDAKDRPARLLLCLPSLPVTVPALSSPCCFLLSPDSILSHNDSHSLARFVAMSCARGTSVAVLISSFCSLSACPLLLCLFVLFRLSPSWSLPPRLPLLSSLVLSSVFLFPSAV